MMGRKLRGSEFVVNREHAGERVPTWRNSVDDAFALGRWLLVWIGHSKCPVYRARGPTRHSWCHPHAEVKRTGEDPYCNTQGPVLLMKRHP